jgi:diacylglycerol kinase (ATP)
MSSAPRDFTSAGRLRSIRFAVNGISEMIRSQHNAWIHAAATIAACAAGFLVKLSASEWCWITLAITAVWTAEALNTAIELLIDVASPESHPIAGKAKDVAAGAVLISALGAAVIGVLVFGPRLIARTRG